MARTFFELGEGGPFWCASWSGASSMFYSLGSIDWGFLLLKGRVTWVINELQYLG